MKRPPASRFKPRNLNIAQCPCGRPFNHDQTFHNTRCATCRSRTADQHHWPFRLAEPTTPDL